jgi:ABC-type multidrug transport system ATPase subunit
MSALDMLHHLAILKGITNKNERAQMVEALLQQTNLWDARKKSLSTYSGGIKQRFGIAQSLLANPRLIIVDERTAGLDPAERNRFLNLLSSIGSNVTVTRDIRAEFLAQAGATYKLEGEDHERYELVQSPLLAAITRARL